MARKRRVQSAFFEAITAAPFLPRTFRTPANTTSDNLDGSAALENEISLGWLNDNRFTTDAKAVAHDTWVVLRGIGRRLVAKPARIAYIMAIGSATAVGGYSAVSVAMQTMNQYSPIISSPALIMNMKKTGTTILDRNGVVLYQGYGAVDRKNITLDQMPDTLKQATLATEDPTFYDHGGFSVRGTARAAYQDVLQNSMVQGGSTITQQLVKNTLLSTEKSFTRKYKELVLSTELERRYTKDEILEMYLNTIYYGQGAYGIEAASQTYFSKSAKDLTKEESALLAGLPQSPSRWDPNINMNAATQRRNYVADRMVDQGYATSAEATAIKTAQIDAGTFQPTLKAPHFVFYVLRQLRQQYGDEAVEKGGITVTTTLDYAKQEKAQEIVKTKVTNLASKRASNGGLVSLDPKNGDIISMVGSVDYYQPGFGAVNVMLSELQPGSSFKPIAYATAFTKGWNGATVVDDKPMNLPDGPGRTYTPQNYDRTFRGPVLLRRSLSNSLNIPAIEVIRHAGLTETIAMAHSLGISPQSLDDPSKLGVSLVLGGGEVRGIDMAAVYATFANGGKAVTPHAIIKVSDRNDKDITKPRDKSERQAIDPRVAFMITNILSDTKSREEEFGVNNPLKLTRPVAAKTGTTNDFRDNWAVGYTPDLATAVWVGNNDHSPMINVDGVTGAAPIWHDYMEMALADIPARDFTQPGGVVFAKVCSMDGGLASENDPNAINEVFLEGTQPTKPCGSIRPRPQASRAPQPSTPAPNSTPVPVPATPVPEPGRGATDQPTPPPADPPTTDGGTPPSAQ